MGRVYNVIDADGHNIEAVWYDYSKEK